MDSIVRSGGDLCEFFKTMFRRKKWLSHMVILFGARVGSAGDPGWDGS
jgi:hypothetical protein